MGKRVVLTAWQRLAGSRKFWLMLAGVLVPILNRKLGLGLSPVEVGGVMAIIAANIAGIAYEDGCEHGSNK